MTYYIIKVDDSVILDIEYKTVRASYSQWSQIWYFALSGNYYVTCGLTEQDRLYLTLKYVMVYPVNETDLSNDLIMKLTI